MGREPLESRPVPSTSASQIPARQTRSMTSNARRYEASVYEAGGETMAKDPVCGMEVDPQQAARTSEYQGQTYYFCAPGCKKSFDKEPEKYLGKADEHTDQH